jgi:hypothetical protein
MAGLNLTAEELEVLAVGYANPEDPTLRVHYTCVPIRSMPPPPPLSHTSPVKSTERGGTTDDATRDAVPTARAVFEGGHWLHSACIHASELHSDP